MEQINSATDVIKEHRQRIDTIKASIREELNKLGHQTDDEIRLVDGQAVMMFILPSTGSVYIGFGPTGAQQAYRGPDSGPDNGLKPAEIAATISGWLNRQT